MHEKICLLADVFLANGFLNTLEKHQIPTYAVKSAKSKIKHNLNLISLEEAGKAISENPNIAIYTNAEDVLDIIYKFSKNKRLINGIKMLKNKGKLQEKLASYYPEIYFKKLSNNELESYKSPEGRKLIVKPSIGFHSAGIRTFTNQKEFEKIIPKIRNEISEYANVFSLCALNGETYLITDYFTGTEYACDGFYDENGEPVITAIYQHDFADEKDTRDLVYWTSSKLMEKMLPKASKFMRTVSEKTQKFIRMPVHFEFRVKNEKIYLIEFNVMRYGGFGLSDLPKFAFGFDPFECFFNQTKPDWEDIFEKNDKNNYAFIIGRRDNYSLKDKKVDHESFKKTFSNLLSYQPIDHTRFSMFSVALCKHEDMNEIRKYLWYNFDKYFY